MSGNCSLVLFAFSISIVWVFYLNHALLSMETNPKLPSTRSLFVAETVSIDEGNNEEKTDWKSFQYSKVNRTVLAPKYQFSVVIVTHNEKLLEKTFDIFSPLRCSVMSVIENTNPDYLLEACCINYK